MTERRYENGSTSSPRLQIRLDVDTSKETAWKTYDLPRAQSATNKCSAALPNSSVFDIAYQSGPTSPGLKSGTSS